MSETSTCGVLQQDVDAIFGPSTTQHTETQQRLSVSVIQQD